MEDPKKIELENENITENITEEQPVTDAESVITEEPSAAEPESIAAEEPSRRDRKAGLRRLDEKLKNLKRSKAEMSAKMKEMPCRRGSAGDRARKRHSESAAGDGG